MQFDPQALGAITDVAREQSWTGGELAAAIRCGAGLLSRHGVGPGGHVVIAHGGTPAFFADLFAAWHAGACAVCTDPGLTPGELANICDFVSADAVLVAEPFTGGEGVTAPILVSAREAADDPGAAALSPRSGLDDPALILFTSGTTGTPKGVVHSFRSLLARTTLNQAHMGRGVLARSLCVLPTHFGHGLIGNCLTPLLGGHHLHLYSKSGVRGAGELGAVLQRHGISFMSSVPAFWKLVLKVAAPPEEHTLEQVHVGSAPLSAELWRAIMDWTGTDRVLNMYGITETANWLAGACAADLEPADGLLGAMWGGRAGVVDANGCVTGSGEGELAVQTPALMQGYFKRPDLTAEVLRDGWFLTGDTGAIGEDGLIRMTGRRKHEINRAGMKVHPEEIDLLMERHPDVMEACAFGLPDDISGEVVAVAIKLLDGAEGGDDVGKIAALKTWCRERLRRESVPEKWYIVPEIPKTDRGKINRQRVMAYCLERSG
jgi:acyl-CoA synthetase (AMP-forming)/AMP-acid ligase II